MVEITKYARNLLLDTLSANLEYSNDYGTPPIFNWYRNMIDSSLLINNCRYIRRGQYRYNLGQSLGLAHITVDYAGKTRFIIITDYEINENSLFSWQDSTEESGIVPKEKTRIRKNWRKINKQPLFGYQYIINNKREYNLINNQEQPITQWFKDIKTQFQQPYGQYKIIAYLNIGGFAYALSIDGQTYPLN